MSLPKLGEQFLAGFQNEDGWSDRCFGVLDDKSVEDGKTLIIAAVDGDNDRGWKVAGYRCEFGCGIDQLIMYEETDRDIAEDLPELIDGEGVYTVKRFKEEMGLEA